MKNKTIAIIGIVSFILSVITSAEDLEARIGYKYFKGGKYEQKGCDCCSFAAGNAIVITA
jgi:hypothetical protein